MKCDLCAALDAKWYGPQQVVIYCNRPSCLTEANRIIDNYNDELARAMRTIEDERERTFQD